LYPGITPPVVLGSDGAGEILELGDGVSDLSRGQAVVVNPGLDWGTDEGAQAADFRILGNPDDGTFATHLLVDARQVHPMPTHLDFTEAAALPLAGLTAWRALSSRGQAQAGETVLISGIGGGVAAWAQTFAQHLGCRVVTTSSNAEKRQASLGLGAAASFDYRDEGWTKDLTSSIGSIDLVIDGAAGSGMNDFLKVTRPGGRIVCYGGTAGLPEALNIRPLFWKQIDLRGSTMGSPADFAAMLSALVAGGLRPVVDSVHPLGQVNEALAAMEQGKQCGKLVLDTTI
jgi:NADPH:quinone reductase-like Zn-dependent oxidoreductase